MGGMNCVLAVVDDCTRENLARVTDKSPPDQRVTRELDRVDEERRTLGAIVDDSGTKFAS